MKNRLLLSSIALSTMSGQGAVAAEESKPNIIFIFADDMGYGDVKCNNPELRESGYETACIGKWHIGMDGGRAQMVMKSI